MFKYAVGVACALCTIVSAQDGFAPARYRAGTIPPVSVRAVGGGEVLVEAAIDREGRVTEVIPLKTTAPFTELVIEAVRTWQFDPAHEEAVAKTTERVRRPIPGKVLVAAVFRPPSLNTPTIGEPSRDAASPSNEVPFPLTTTVPSFPPRAYSNGVVLVEARIDRNGAVARVDVIRSAPPFDSAAQDAVSQWSFRPAQHERVRVPSLAYVLLGFPLPVSDGPAAVQPVGR